MQTADLKKTRDYGIATFITAVVVSTALAALFYWAGGAYNGYNGPRPDFMPPDIATILMDIAARLLFGLSLFVVLRMNAHSKDSITVKNASVIMWLTVFAMGLCWPFAFFYLKLYMFSFIWLAITAAITVALMIINFRISVWSALLVLPYLAYLAFYCYLNLIIAL